MSQPHYIKCGEYVKGGGDLNRELLYLSGLSFTFDSEDDYRLCTIAVNDNGHKIYGRDIVGLPINAVKFFMSKQADELPKYEDWSSVESPKHVLLDYDSLGLFLWFNDEVLDEIQFSYLFCADGNTVIWPD